MTIKPKDQKIVWGQSAGRCAICKIKLILPNVGNSPFEIVGEMAHIEGEKPNSKRYNSTQTEGERDGNLNIILLCPNDHTLIDKDEIKYTVEVLKKIKNDHNDFVNNSIKAELPNITFAELQVIVSYLVSPSIEYEYSYSLDHIPPKEKIDKNKLSPATAAMIAMGIARVKEVKNYLNSNPDINFSEKLRTRLSDYYLMEKKNESDPNILFNTMLDYMSEESSNFKKRAAALAVLTYFFETCDIFEK